MAHLLHRIASFRKNTGAAPVPAIAKKPHAYSESRKTIEEPVSRASFVSARIGHDFALLFR
jgi:hypothetical protein